MKAKSVILDIFFTLVTFGLWNFWVQYRQIRDINKITGGDEIPSVWFVAILSLITFGLYFCYHEYRLTRELHQLNYGETYPLFEVLFCLLTYVGLWFVVDSYQQYLLNQYIESKSAS